MKNEVIPEAKKCAKLKMKYSKATANGKGLESYK